MALPRWDAPALDKEVAQLLGSGDRLPALAPKTGDPGALKALDALKPKTKPPVMAGLYLYFDHLDPAHKIAQDIDTPTGSFWHGIMHRREPDDENSGYWFHKTGAHPALKTLSDRAKRHLDASGDKALGQDLLPGGSWDPLAFIRACSAARTEAPAARVTLLNELQLLEWRCLFEFSLKP